MTINISAVAKKEIGDGTRTYFCFSAESRVIRDLSGQGGLQRPFILHLKYQVGDDYSITYRNAKAYLRDGIYFIMLGSPVRKEVYTAGNLRSIIFVSTKEQLRRVKQNLKKVKDIPGQLSFSLAEM
jgi:hypothetical protein